METDPLKRKDLLSIRELSAAEILFLLDQMETFREINEREIKKVPTLRGKTIVNLFFEPSTRTRTSFEIAGKRLSADVINISTSVSATEKGKPSGTRAGTSRPWPPTSSSCATPPRAPRPTSRAS